MGSKMSLPANLEAEQSVIGALLLAPGSIAKVFEVLTPGDFHHPGWGAVYEALCALARDGRPVDALTVSEAMRSAGTLHMLTSLGGVDALVSVQSMVLGVEGVVYHAEIISKKARRRRVTMAAQALAGRGMADTDDDDFLAEAREVGMSFSAPGRGDTGLRPPGHYLKQFLQEMELRSQRVREGKTAGMPTAFAGIDALLGGLYVGEVMIVGARPGMGKTSFLMGTAINAGRSRVPSLIFSKEMRGMLLWERSVSAFGGIQSGRLRKGIVDPAHMAAVLKTSAELSNLPVLMDDDGRMTIEDIRARVQGWRSQQPDGPAIVGVDYVQLVRSRSKKVRSREEEVAEVSAGLKDIAKSCGVAVVALASLNREVEKREDKRPKPSDLRDSGAVESDADIVALMYRDEVYNCRTDSPGVAEFIVGKNRNGPVGRVRLRWEGDFVRFSDLEATDRMDDQDYYQ